LWPEKLTSQRPRGPKRVWDRGNEIARISSPTRPRLALELAYVAEGGSMHLFDDQLADRHLGVERDIQRAEVYQLQRDRAVELGVDRRGGEVDQKPTAGIGAFPLNAGGERNRSFRLQR